MFTAKIDRKEYKTEFTDTNFLKGIVNGKSFHLDIVKNNDKSYHIIFNNKSYNIIIISADNQEKNISLKINGKPFDVKVYDELDILLKNMGIKSKKADVKKELRAPMPGLIVNIPVKKGDFVKQGETLLVLEAMKMENNLKAETDVTIKDIKAKTGNSAEKNEVLIVFE